MTMMALVEGERIAQVVQLGDVFPVAPPLMWVEVPDNTTEGDKYTNNQVVKSIPLPPSVDDVKREAQRRIFILCLAETFEEAMVKQMNAQSRATELLDIGEENWTPEQAIEAQALRDLRSAIKSVRDASNLIEQDNPISSDFATDKRWP